MTTGIQDAAGVEAGELEELLGDPVRSRTPAPQQPAPQPTSLSLSESVAVPAAAAVTSRYAFPVTAPDQTAFAPYLIRSLKTAAPLLAADVLALAASGLAAEGVLRLVHPHGGAALGSLAAVALLPLVLGYWLGGLYSEVWVHPAVELRQATLVTTVALLAAALAGIMAPPLAVWCAAAWVAAVVLAPIARGLARCYCAGRTWWGFPTVIIGSSSAAEAMTRTLTASCRSGLRPALVTDPDGICRTAAVPVVNDPALLRSLVRAKGIRHAVLCLPDHPTAKVSRSFDRYCGLASHLLVVCEDPPLPDLWGAPRFCGAGSLQARNGLLLPNLQALKRAADVAIALLALTAGLPLLLAVAVLVKLSSPGPVLYGHTRIGRYGRRFTAWKFRTMYRGADALLRKHFERFPKSRLEWERDHKLRYDPRVTRVGRLLRRSSLDELPQMWNVLRGEMSVVGPRPIVDDEVARYADGFELYTAVKPGITGLWQVSGRTDVGYETRVRLDAFYVRHWSPWLDAYVLARTFVALLCRRGAY
jgi:Undecaprenyl-phosphate galactose phosphotransferase WbaP